MQAVKDKLHDMSEMRKVKAEAKAEEKAEKELAKARMDIAHEVRMAKEAEAEMELHVSKAGVRAQREIEKHTNQKPNANHSNAAATDTGPIYHDHHHPTTTTGAAGRAPPS
ncbi:late embryogenesis abundant protein [Tripterygium wilfordii]|uniref:Late embryogenesis abundant protein n=1 Tax=Tripterygium wilfordii TaxID=458696 RepID=A0A7J7CF96_TRIWF|nr:late embryogenesis abundant protein 6-like [Tripterygium wilfordii]KAF5732809.1 late embryogenesis abundant protein [Tripterygium wilfordii]